MATSEILTNDFNKISICFKVIFECMNGDIILGVSFTEYYNVQNSLKKTKIVLLGERKRPLCCLCYSLNNCYTKGSHVKDLLGSLREVVGSFGR